MGRKDRDMNEIKVFTRTDDGRISKVIEYSTGKKVEIPVNKDGSIKWYADKMKGQEVKQYEEIHS